MTVLAATSWPTNAELIADVASLYYRAGMQVVDLTWGSGVWWRKFQPDNMICNDWNADGPRPSWITGVTHESYHELPNAWSDRFDIVAYDPPYVSTSSGVGGRSKTTIPAFYKAYGLMDAPPGGVRELFEDNMGGLTEAARVAKPGGMVWAKCQPYVSSGKYHDVDYWFRNFAVQQLRLKVADRFIHVGSVRPQPSHTDCAQCGGTGSVLATTLGDGWPDSLKVTCPKCGGKGGKPRQVKHARSNASILYVFTKPHARRKR